MENLSLGSDMDRMIRLIHDEKLMLQRIMDCTNLVAQADNQGKLSSVVSDINSGCAQMIRAHEQVCETSQYQHIYPMSTDVVCLARSVTRMNIPTAMKRGIVLSFCTNLPCLTACVDPQLIKRMLLNLAANAIEHAPMGGSVIIRLKKTRSMFVLSVFNSGNGVDKRVMPRMFDMYASCSVRGTGIGLSSAQLIAQCHGGSIRCQSKPGKGTLVEAFIPLKL